MEFKLFGKSLFEFRTARSDVPMSLGINALAESKYLPDFYKLFNRGGDSSINHYAILTDLATTASTGFTSGVAVPINKEEKKAEEPKKEEKQYTPKEVYELKTLHDETYKLNTDPEYVDAQLADFKDKLGLIKTEEYDMRNGAIEIASIVARLENRKKYPEVKDFFEQFPYTTTKKMEELVKNHKNLQIGQIAEFLADMPREATQVMKDYNKACASLCKKQAVFYIIADKKDFKKTQSRRDPILLVQSPFGHAWQILGAWDEEMLLIEEL